jgi:hypothetical protein
MQSLSGLGACSQSDPSPGTISSINCPDWCIPLGWLADLGYMPQSCWPCSNACPSGYCWDTTNLVCSATPATTNTVVPALQNAANPPAPVDCTSTWNQLTSSQCGASSLPLIIGGVVILAVVGAVLANKV